MPLRRTSASGRGRSVYLLRTPVTGSLILLLAAIIYYLPRAPKKIPPPPTAGDIPVQPANKQLQFSNLKLSVAHTGGAMNLDGQLMNTGDRPVLGATVELTFRDPSGKALETADRPIKGLVEKMARLRPMSPELIRSNPISRACFG